MSNDWGFDWDAEAARRAGGCLDLAATGSGRRLRNPFVHRPECIMQMTLLNLLPWLRRCPPEQAGIGARTAHP